MTEINVDDESGRSGLMALLVTVFELLLEAMEREAVRRMESGRLTDEEIDRLGTQLARLESELAEIKREEGIEGDVEKLKGDLDSVVDDAIRAFDVEREPIESNGEQFRSDVSNTDQRWQHEEQRQKR